MNNELAQIAEGMFTTFVHRRDSFAIQLESGQYVSVKNQITVNDIASHLKGEKTLSVYILGENGTAKLSVIDADDEEGLEKLRDGVPGDRDFVIKLATITEAREAASSLDRSATIEELDRELARLRSLGKSVSPQ